MRLKADSWRQRLEEEGRQERGRSPGMAEARGHARMPDGASCPSPSGVPVAARTRGRPEPASSGKVQDGTRLAGGLAPACAEGPGQARRLSCILGEARPAGGQFRTSCRSRRTGRTCRSCRRQRRPALHPHGQRFCPPPWNTLRPGAVRISMRHAPRTCRTGGRCNASARGATAGGAQRRGLAPCGCCAGAACDGDQGDLPCLQGDRRQAGRPSGPGYRPGAKPGNPASVAAETETGHEPGSPPRTPAPVPRHPLLRFTCLPSGAERPSKVPCRGSFSQAGDLPGGSMHRSRRRPLRHP